MPWGLHRGWSHCPRPLEHPCSPRSFPSCLIWGTGGPHSEPGSELHPQKGDPFLYASGFDPSPEMLVLPKLSEVPCWNPSAQPARGPREEGGGLHCLLFPPQTGPSLRLGSGLDAVEISLGKSHKPIRNLTSFAFSD